MTHLTPLIGNYVWIAAWFGSCLLLGMALWGRLSEDDPYSGPAWPNPELAVFLTVCTGLGVHILVLIALALPGFLNAGSIITAYAALNLASLFYLYRNPAGWDAFMSTFRQNRSEWFRVLPVVLIIIPWTLSPLGPAKGMDALTYHLPYAQFYLEQGGLAVNENLRFPLHTHNVNLLYSVALLRPGAQLAQSLHACMGFLALLGVYGIARHWYGWLSAVLASAGILLLEEFRISFSYAFADNGALLFITAAFLAMALWAERRQPRLLWFCALFAGTAMGSKYFGALFTVPLGLFVLFTTRDLRLFARFAVLTSACGLFWYVRSWWISGNPVHPFAGELFGHYLWNAAELAANLRELGGWGVEKSWLNFLLLPERVYSQSSRFNGETGHVGILLGAFVFSLALLRYQKPSVRMMQMTCLAYLLFWFWSSQVVRYLMLIVPLMSLCTVSAVSAAVTHYLPARPIRTPALNAMGLLLVVTLLAWGGWNQLRHQIATTPLTADSRHQHLLKWMPAYGLGIAASANPRIGAGPLLQFQLSEIRFFFKGSVAGDWMGKHGWKNYAYPGDTGHWIIDESATLHEKATREGFKAVAMHKSPPRQFKPQEIDSYRGHFEIVFETPSGVLMIPRQKPDFDVD